MAEAIEKAKKTVHGSYYGAPTYNVHVPAATRNNSASQATQAEKTPEKENEQNLAEVSLPFAVPGGFKDINIDFKLKTNDKGEHVITNTEEISKAMQKIVNGLVQDALAAKSPSEKKSQARTAPNEEEMNEHVNVKKEAVTSTPPQTQKSQAGDARLAYDARWMSVSYHDLRTG